MTLHVIASAGALFSARRFSEAERMLSAAIARCADDDILEQLLYHRGRCLRKLALHAACAEDFSRVVHHGGKLASVARAYRGTALAELGLITLAVQDYTVALECVCLPLPTPAAVRSAHRACVWSTYNHRSPSPPLARTTTFPSTHPSPRSPPPTRTHTASERMTFQPD